MNYGYAPQPVPVAGPVAMPMQLAGKGTLPLGARVRIGEYKVVVDRFLSEGGFAHVYLVKSATPIPPNSDQYLHVLKRLAVPDKPQLQLVRKEVDIMKQLRGHRHIVNFIEASASELANGAGYEVFILMEYAPGGGIIDMMNTRLENRLTESEILKIFSDTVEAVAHMHHQDPPLMHRDLKVENILLASASCYKLCDFGSATSPLPSPPQTAAEIQALEADLNRTTTLQYRAPEMCDVWSRRPVGLPADIWALGVFLYKLCYYTTPFENQGILAIQNAQYSFPSYPAYSKSIKDLISSMLQEHQEKRPTIYQVHENVCKLRGVKTRISDRPSLAAPNLPRRPNTAAMAAATNKPQDRSPSVVFTHSVSPPAADTEPHLSGSVTPMRRGRPATSAKAAIPFTSTFQAQSEQPKSASAPALNEYADFNQAFPALPNEQVDINVTHTGEAPQRLQSDPSSRSQGMLGFGDSFTPLEVERSASGFQELLSGPPEQELISRKPSQKHSSELHNASPKASVTSYNATTGKHTSIPDVRRQRTSNSSTYIDRSSQTSPVLLEKWWQERKLREHEGAMEQPRKPSDIVRQRTTSSSSAKPALPPKPKHLPSQLIRGKQPSVDLLAASPEPVTPPSTAAPPSASIPHSSSKSSIETSTSPQNAREDVTNALSTLRANIHRGDTIYSDSDDKEDVLDVIKSFSSKMTGPKLAPTFELSDDDDDDELEGPEDPEARYKPRNASSSFGAPDMNRDVSQTSSISSTSPDITQRSGEARSLTESSVDSSEIASISAPVHVDSVSPKTAAASLKNLQLRSPTLQAPVAQSPKPKAAISNLVSRYETLSTSAVTQQVDATLNKPTKKRPDSMYNSNAVRHNSDSSDRSAFSPGSSPKTPIYRPTPFKPNKPAHGEPVAQAEDTEEAFAGVKNMKARWQQNIAEQSGVRRAASLSSAKR